MPLLALVAEGQRAKLNQNGERAACARMKDSSVNEIRDRTYENQQHRASGLNLVVTVSRDNLDDEPATIRMTLRRRRGDEGRATPVLRNPGGGARPKGLSSGGNGGWVIDRPSLWRGPFRCPADMSPITR